MALSASDAETRSATQHNGSEAANAELGEIRRDLAALAHSVKVYGRHRSGDAVEDIRELLEGLQHNLTIAEKKVEKNMREHPREWIGSAVGLLGVGVALGLIFGRRD